MFQISVRILESAAKCQREARQICWNCACVSRVPGYLIFDAVFLSGIVKNDSQGVSVACTHGADAVTKTGAVVAARAAHGPMMNGKDDRIALVRPENFNAGLPARPLLRKNEFAAYKLVSAPAQEKGNLKRKREFSV